jgi:putative endonuclease
MACAHKKSCGAQGEEAARRYVQQQGYRIRALNYTSRLGEVDIIAQDGDTLVFIEVKARSSGSKGAPKESVTPRKQLQISKAALAYLKEHKLFESRARFDVVSVDYSAKPPAIELIKSAFELSARFSY